MKEVKLKSGGTLRMQLAAFDDAMTLLEVVLMELVGVSIEGFKIEELLAKDMSQLKDAVFKVIASRKVKDALWVCMGSSMYAPPGDNPDGALRIDRATFNDEKARGDYFPVAGEVAQFNLAPFFKNLELPSSLLARAGGTPDPRSQTT